MSGHRLPHPWRWLVGLGILAALGAGLVVATSGGDGNSGAHHSAASPSLTEAQAAEQYLAATEPVNTAGAAFNAKARNFNTATTSAQAGSVAGPLSAALQAATAKLETVAKGYAPGASALRGDIEAATALGHDLGALARLNRGLTVSAWTQQFTADTATAKNAANVARAALGLAPVDS